jgi:uncharacterized protein (DUF433 family)
MMKSENGKLEMSCNRYKRFNHCKRSLPGAILCAIVGRMSKTSVMTLRLAPEVARGVEILARRFGHKPAQVGARLVEEGLRRRDFPRIELRDTIAGRVGYLAGTRFAVYWVARAVRGDLTPEDFAREYEMPVESVRAALAYAAAFPKEIEGDIAHAEANRTWLENQQAADFAPRKTRKQTGGRERKHKVAG